MAHPPALLAVANACHRDMDPSMRTRILRAVVATLERPPRSIVSLPDRCQAEKAMEILDYLEYSMAPVGNPNVGLLWENHTDNGVDMEDTWRRLTQAMVVLLLGIAFSSAVL
jgi:hypothetical protein